MAGNLAPSHARPHDPCDHGSMVEEVVRDVLSPRIRFNLPRYDVLRWRRVVVFAAFSELTVPSSIEVPFMATVNPSFV